MPSYRLFFITQAHQLADFSLESDPSIQESLLELDLQFSDSNELYCLSECAQYFENYNLLKFQDVGFLKASKNQVKSHKVCEAHLWENRFFYVQNDLIEILEEDELEFSIYEEDEYYDYSFQEGEEINEQTLSVVAQNFSQEPLNFPLPSEKDKSQIIDTHVAQGPSCLLLRQWEKGNVKKDIISKLKNIVSGRQGERSDDEKIEMMKEVIQEFIFDHQKYYFQDAMKQLRQNEANPAQILAILIKGIEQTFKRVIGGSGFERRRIQLLKYMDKKKRRDWKKKVNYDCRKKVADNRLRYKGKFINSNQVIEKFGLNVESLSPEEMKQILARQETKEEI